MPKYAGPAKAKRLLAEVAPRCCEATPQDCLKSNFRAEVWHGGGLPWSPVPEQASGSARALRFWRNITTSSLFFTRTKLKFSPWPKHLYQHSSRPAPGFCARATLRPRTTDCSPRRRGVLPTTPTRRCRRLTRMTPLPPFGYWRLSRQPATFCFKIYLIASHPSVHIL